MSAVTVAGIMTTAAGLGLLFLSRRLASSRRRRCGCCRPESLLAPWKLRAWQLVLRGPGWTARIRHGLGRAEYEERVRFGMAMNHPDWLTAELPGEFEELLAGLDASTWEDR